MERSVSGKYGGEMTTTFTSSSTSTSRPTPSPFGIDGGEGGEISAEMLMPTQQQEAQVRAIIEAKKDVSAKKEWRVGRWSEEVGRQNSPLPSV